MVTLLCSPPSCAVQVGYDKERLAEESANPVLLVSESDRPGTAPAKHLKPEMVRTRPLPLFRDVNFTYHGPVEMGHYTDFDELGQMGSKVRAVRLGWLEPRIGQCRCAVCAARSRPYDRPFSFSALLSYSPFSPQISTAFSMPSLLSLSSVTAYVPPPPHRSAAVSFSVSLRLRQLLTPLPLSLLLLRCRLSTRFWATSPSPSQG